MQQNRTCKEEKASSATKFQLILTLFPLLILRCSQMMNYHFKMCLHIKKTDDNYSSWYNYTCQIMAKIRFGDKNS